MRKPQSLFCNFSVKIAQPLIFCEESTTKPGVNKSIKYITQILLRGYGLFVLKIFAYHAK